MTMTRSDFIEFMKPVIDGMWQEAINKETYYDKYFEVRKSNDGHEEYISDPGFGLASKIDEGEGRYYDSTTSGILHRVAHDEYSLGYKLTNLLIEDGKAPFRINQFTPRLAESMMETKEILAAEVLNEAFSATNRTYADGKELIASNHPSLAGNRRNELAAPADFSEAALEQVDADLDLIVNERGIRRHLKARGVIVAHSARFEAHRVLSAEGQVYSANVKTPNAIKDLRLFPEGYLALPYIDSADDWFVVTNAKDGLVMYNRKEMQIENDNDFNTRNELVGATMRLSHTVFDVFSIFGSEGTS